MSRLDADYLSIRGFTTWRQAYSEAANALDEAPASFKNLRDEFDPVHPNPRRGWHRRALRPDRQRVLDELQEVSDDALLELVARILTRDNEATDAAIDSLAVTTRVAHNVAERLLTGRRAEEYLLAHTRPLLGVDAADILDFRQAARGFDFGIRGRHEKAVEVKGLKERRGDIQFTDREWSEAKYRGSDYILVVVGNLVAKPVARVMPDPHALLDARCTYQKSISAVWRSIVDVSCTAPAPLHSLKDSQEGPESPGMLPGGAKLLRLSHPGPAGGAGVGVKQVAVRAPGCGDQAHAASPERRGADETADTGKHFPGQQAGCAVGVAAVGPKDVNAALVAPFPTGNQQVLGAATEPVRDIARGPDADGEVAFPHRRRVLQLGRIVGEL